MQELTMEPVQNLADEFVEWIKKFTDMFISVQNSIDAIQSLLQHHRRDIVALEERVKQLEEQITVMQKN